MPLFLYDWINILLLVTALSIDAFAAGLAYGLDRIRIPFLSMVIVGGMSAGSLLVSLLAGRGILSGIEPGYAKLISASLLFLAGLVKLFDGAVKCLIRRRAPAERHLDFRIFDLRFLLTVYADPNCADADCGGRLSPKEACTLGIALSFDSMAAGLGAGIAAAPVLCPVLLSFLLGMAAVGLGVLFGDRLLSRCSLDFTWAGGLLLIVLAFLKMRH